MVGDDVHDDRKLSLLGIHYASDSFFFFFVFAKMIVLSVQSVWLCIKGLKVFFFSWHKNSQ